MRSKKFLLLAMTTLLVGCVSFKVQAQDNRHLTEKANEKRFIEVRNNYLFQWQNTGLPCQVQNPNYIPTKNKVKQEERCGYRDDDLFWRKVMSGTIKKKQGKRYYQEVNFGDYNGLDILCYQEYKDENWKKPVGKQRCLKYVNGIKQADEQGLDKTFKGYKKNMDLYYNADLFISEIEAINAFDVTGNKIPKKFLY